MTSPLPPYSYSASTKSAVSDELVNTYVIRPLAGMIVRLLYRTAATPNGVTALSIVAGCCAGVLYATGTPASVLAAGLCVSLKDILDAADGQLARAKQLFSRRGRFFDSIGDFFVNLVVFTAVGWMLVRTTGHAVYIPLALMGFLGTTLRVSYHVFYQTSYLHLKGTYTINRITEDVRPEDRAEDRLTQMLQSIFLFLYGWQDRLMLRLDEWCRGGMPHESTTDGAWYGDRTGLHISGLMGLGTELFILMLFSLVDRLDLYLVVNLAVLNALWGVSAGYRKWVLVKKVRQR
jgi:phosphatidylglycerophosphate synthase